jgi:predicted acylesterase/phospholipase RssA
MSQGDLSGPERRLLPARLQWLCKIASRTASWLRDFLYLILPLRLHWVVLCFFVFAANSSQFRDSMDYRFGLSLPLVALYFVCLLTSFRLAPVDAKNRVEMFIIASATAAATFIFAHVLRFYFLVTVGFYAAVWFATFLVLPLRILTGVILVAAWLWPEGREFTTLPIVEFLAIVWLKRTGRIPQVKGLGRSFLLALSMPFRAFYRLGNFPLSPGVSMSLLLCLPVVILVTIPLLPKVAASIPLPALLMMEVALWLLLLTELQTWSRRSALPVVTMLVLWGGFLSCMGWNYHHNVRLLKVTDTSSPLGAITSVKQVFSEWLQSRNDRGDFLRTDQPYPVILVAAEGGGIRAAYATALLLQELERRWPAFRHHLFAISGVSGGSIGAAYFAAKSQPDAQQTPVDEPDGVFTQNFLSGPMAALLGPEIFQRVLPSQFPFWDRWEVTTGFGLDRAVSLEQGFEAAVKSGFESSPLEGDFCTGYEPKRDVPLLLLNATEATTGRRVVFSPVAVDEDKGAIYPIQEDPSLHIRLSTAAVLSARFPLVSPAGNLLFQQHSSLMLVDGGYLDNTGTETLGAVVRAISTVSSETRYSLIILSPKFSDVRTDGRTGPGGTFDLALHFAPASGSAVAHHQGSFELLPVVEALMNSQSRLSSSPEKLSFVLRSLGGQIPYACIDFPLFSDRRKEPLGWSLSKASSEQLKAELRSQLETSPEEAIWPPERIDVHALYRYSLDASSSQEPRYSALLANHLGGFELRLAPRLASMRSSDLPEPLRWGFVTRPDGALLPELPEEITLGLNALTEARNAISEDRAHSGYQWSEQDAYRDYALGVLDGTRAPIAHPSPDRRRYWGRLRESIDSRKLPSLDISERDDVRWKAWGHAAYDYQQALIAFRMLNTPEAATAQQIVEAELNQLREMYKQRWPGEEFNTAFKDVFRSGTDF